jgi:tripartite-type tricarboxylate transporter receptor subunit TctC
MFLDKSARVLRSISAALLVGASLLGLAAPAAAQGWPNKPITVIIPFPAGGGTDAFGRPLFAQLTKQLGQQVVIDNRGGAGGNVGAGLAAKAAPDGYTWFMGAVHHTIAPSIYPKLDYHLVNDFIPVALISLVPQVIVVNPQKVPAKTLPELLAYLKANPAKLSYGSAGNGSSHHLAGELFKSQTRTFITHIPYRGAGPALQDLIGGQVDMMFDGLGSSALHIKSGRLRPIAVASAQRAPGFPDIPTSAEGGLPSYRVATWYGLWAPKGTPKDVVDRMAAELRTAFATKEIKDAWVGLGSEMPTLAGAAFGDFVNAETKRWEQVVKAGNIKIE